MRQAPPSQLPTPFGAESQCSHRVPQLFGSLSGEQNSSQRCVPVGHSPSHGASRAMQRVLHSFRSAGHSGTQKRASSQRALPPSGVGHGWQDAPQPSGLESETHRPSHSWKFASQATPQLTPSHVACPSLGAGQGSQRAPQVARAVFGAHCPLHS
jgi:hypothetical protein